MIRKYSNKDYDEISKITYRCWQGEVTLDFELEKLIYDFLPRYYLCDNSFSYVDDCDGVQAFLISSKYDDKNNALQIWNEGINNLPKNNRDKAKEYFDYLEYNHHRVLKHMNNKSIYLALIASIKHKSGEALINKLKEDAKKEGYKDIYLWTDETCNYQYYEKKGFILVEEYMVSLFDKPLKTFVYMLKI